MNKVVTNAAVVAALAFSLSAAFAQTTPPAPAHQGLLSRLFHPKPKPGVYQSNGSAMHPMGSRPMMGGSSMMMGHVVGNKKTHVYHLPGDSGSLPAPQNRVYFSSAAAAQAAGFHRAGGGAAVGGNMMTHHVMPSMMHH